MDYDLVIIGGGIHGVGVAQAAAAGGYQVALLEQTELAAGTSRRSSKLIHGGLRYLESGEFSLVRESVRERELLLKLAPDLVKRQKFFIPVYRYTSRSRWWLLAGLGLYTLLAGFGRWTGFKRIAKSQWDDLDGLTTESLQEVFQYTDAQTDDAALTRAVMASAQSLDAELLCPAEFVGARIHSGGWDIEYCVDDQLKQITSRVLVNAAGPWAQEVAHRCDPELPIMQIENVQGTHLELEGGLNHGCYYLEVPEDKRAVFAMPWKHNRTLLGTTERTYQGDPAKVQPVEEEEKYLLSVYQHYFPGRPVGILDSWAGLRVLPATQGEAFKRSRETQLPVDDEVKPNAISILGGKLTGYRATAEKVMNILRRNLPKRVARGDTRTLTLTPN